MTAKKRITEAALKLLDAHPDGLRHSQLVLALAERLPEISKNTIVGAVVGLVAKNPENVCKPTRGLFKLLKYSDSLSPAPQTPAKGELLSSVKEEDFYPAFAAYLTGDLEECTKAEPLGRSFFKDKWGTPDVIGIRKARESDIIKFPTEIVSAEIKTDGNNLITAFGQAVSYKLFSHKSYIVVPKESSTEDLDRLEALCLTCGLGLILFNHLRVDSPDFTIRVRAQRSEPDNFYVNRNLKRVEELLFS
ncbi:MAG: hypothetical protein KJZ79_16700 [Bryobacteraceae bacterium]|nr:hypothetical protein [Bryobacteraceae bacterium]